jgi:predicted GIY-YIG superfamily endonuclease
MEPPSFKYFCYILTTANCESTYNGYTINLKRRLRQHNGELTGGAKATKKKGKWGYIAVMTCPTWTAVRAMQHEWTIKYPTRRKPRPREFQGAKGRIMSLKKVCEQIPSDEETTLFIREDFLETVQSLNLPNHINLRCLDEIILER